MARWMVKVKVELEIMLVREYEREIEADDETEAERLGEESITDEFLLEKIKENNLLADVEVDAIEAETDDIQCDRCHEYFPADGTLEEIGDELVCNGCMTEEEMEDEEE